MNDKQAEYIIAYKGWTTENVEAEGWFYVWPPGGILGGDQLKKEMGRIKTDYGLSGAIPTLIWKVE